MSAAYDTFDYPSYWVGREYEHKAEILALSAFLSRIKRVEIILDIGAGFGRLTPVYELRGKKVILCDPSAKHLAFAKKEFQQKKFKFVQSTLDNLPKKIGKNSADLIMMIRVIHHIKSIDSAINTVSKLIKKDGYFIIEFPNKLNLKAIFAELLKGNLTVFLDIFPKDIRSKKSIRNKTLPFYNYHPAKIKKALSDNGFKVVEERSVSNIRSRRLKRLLPCDFLLLIEKYTQKIFSIFYFGPSIFILAKKAR